MTDQRVLLVEDDPILRKLVVDTLSENFSVEATDNAEEAVTLAGLHLFQVAVVDVNLPGMSGISLIPHLVRLSPGIVIVVVTGQGSIEIAVEAMKRGATDFLTKPYSIVHLLQLVEFAFQGKKRPPQHASEMEDTGPTIVSVSTAMDQVFADIKNLAPFNTNVLVTGETGTGKELIVRMIHNLSPRSHKPFVALNCAAIPEHLLEDELFGHVKGAYTGAVTNREGRFEQAEGGTLFLDEIGDMSLPLQAKVLRVLQEREFEKLGSHKTIKADVRIVAATSMDLENQIAQNAFRPDLYYRLNVVRIHLPPLRERKEDIPVLAQYFLNRFCTSTGLPGKVIGTATLDLLKLYDWAGNIRQLQNSIERAAILSGLAPAIQPKDLPQEIQRAILANEVLAESEQSGAVPASIPEQGLNFDAYIARIEHDYLSQALKKAGGNKLQAAKLLNMKRTTFIEKLKRHGISTDAEEEE